MYNDIPKSQSIEQLKQQYNLDKKSIEKAVEQQEGVLNKIETELNNYIDATTKQINELQDQVDGNITTWFFDGVPTLDNEPATNWATEEKKNSHLGDLYYDSLTGYAYRFSLENGVFLWHKIVDNDVTEALALAHAAKDTADGKRRVFIEQPIPPYDCGDMWVYNDEIYICQIAKTEGTFENGDFVNSLKYTDDTLAEKVNNDLIVVSGRVLTVEQGVTENKQSIEENKYYVDADGNRQLMSKDLSEIKQTTKDYEILVDSVETLNTTTENNYREIIDKFDGYVPESEMVQLQQQVQTIQTDTYTKTEINTKLTDGSVTKVQTISGTFDENGMHYEKSNAPTKSTINEIGITVNDAEDKSELLFAGYDTELQETIVRTTNLTVNKYFTIGNSRIENYGDGGGMFIL